MRGDWVVPVQGGREFPCPEAFVQRGNTPFNVLCTGAENQAAHGTNGVGGGRLRGYPTFLAGGKIDSVHFEVTTSGAITGRCGIYRNASERTLYPGGLVVDGGDKDCSTTGVKSTSGLNVVIPAGIYWLLTLFSGGGATATRSHAVGGLSSLLGMSSAFLQKSYIDAVFAYGALPDPFPEGATLPSNAPIYLVAVHFES